MAVSTKTRVGQTDVSWKEHFCLYHTAQKKASNQHANLPLEMYSFTL